MANSVREFVIESLKGFYERLPFKKGLTEITYSELKALRDGGNLIPGMQYRITDYECTTVQNNTQSAGHQFDIIVMADSSTVLSENARAAHHLGDTYFANCNIDTWELKYCLDNDTNRFVWVDEEDGTGVIFYMKDEWNNECPYDFKNIMFLRGQDWRDEHPDISQEIFGDCEEEYFYTFSCYDTENLQLGDATLKNCDGVIHDTEECSCFCNTIKIRRGQNGVGQDSGNLPAYLNNIVFFNTYETYAYYFCFSNVFETDCYNNTFGNSCYSNSFGNDCRSNSFGNQCQYNSFGNNCQLNSFGNGCYSNSFGNDCRSNSFGNNCFFISFGDACYYIKFGNSSSTKSYYQYIIVENGNRNIYLDTTWTTSNANMIRNIKIAQGVNNTATWKTISHNTVHDTFQTVYQPADSQTISV